MNIDANNIDEFISKGNVIALFYADWCPYCSAFKPIFESFKAKNCNLIKVKLNEDENPLWDRFNITTIPTLIYFKDGNIIARRDARSGIGLSKADLEYLIAI
ncbi:MAG: thioredoxin family protein [Candidatus Nitrosocaldaceae archaeon]